MRKAGGKHARRLSRLIQIALIHKKKPPQRFKVTPQRRRQEDKETEKFYAKLGKGWQLQCLAVESHHEFTDPRCSGFEAPIGSAMTSRLRCSICGASGKAHVLEPTRHQKQPIYTALEAFDRAATLILQVTHVANERELVHQLCCCRLTAVVD